jgi:hypothetical protein
MATDGLHTGAACYSGALEIVVLRVWREANEDELRGRLIAPVLPEPTAAVGRQQLASLVERALTTVDANLRGRCDGTATQA